MADESNQYSVISIQFRIMFHFSQFSLFTELIQVIRCIK
jgi:hypothetical protein